MTHTSAHSATAALPQAVFDSEGTPLDWNAPLADGTTLTTHGDTLIGKDDGSEYFHLLVPEGGVVLLQPRGMASSGAMAVGTGLRPGVPAQRPHTYDDWSVQLDVQWGAALTGQDGGFPLLSPLCYTEDLSILAGDDDEKKEEEATVKGASKDAGGDDKGDEEARHSRRLPFIERAPGSAGRAPGIAGREPGIDMIASVGAGRWDCQ